MNPYAYQNRIASLIQQGKNIILQAPTGAGKTFAALWPFYIGWAASQSKMPQKCVYAVPMRVLANQFEEEVSRFVAEDLQNLKTLPSIKKQTGEFKRDPEFFADITFATIDQVLSSWLMRPYSLSKRKWNMNAGAFVGSYLIFDEFHLFDPDSTLPTTLHMLKALNGISPFVLMTATFSQEMLQALASELNAEAVLLGESDLANIPAQRKTRRFHTVEQPLVEEDTLFLDQIVEAHLNQDGHQRSLVVCNQVERAQYIYQALRAHPSLADVHIRLLHSRFLQSDRQAIEEEIRREFHKDRANHSHDSMIVVGTQVVEVGLDMSCRALHTELAPASAVLQRAGRCARYEGEVGDVYVYFVPPEKRAPYKKGEAGKQCQRTWDWLQAHRGEHLDFEREQALINHAHGPTDRLILAGLQGSERQWQDRIHELWQVDSPGNEAALLIRNIQSVSVVVHSDPDQLAHAPFRAESFSLHPGTLMGKFIQWRDTNEAIDPDWDEGRLPWLVKKLVEVEEEGEVQGNRPIVYEFPIVRDKNELNAPLLVVHPALVAYSAELGLVLSPEKFNLPANTDRYECPVPPKSTQAERDWDGGYQLESYETHIRLVYEAFSQGWQGWIEAQGYSSWLDWVSAVGARIESVYGWQPGIVAQMAQLVVCLHDLGKLSDGWQGWAREWQASIGNPMPSGEAAAHTDYDPFNPAHQSLDRKLRSKRPSHAVESAFAAYPLLTSLLPDRSYKPLFQAAFTAIARHHGPFTSQPGDYVLVENFEEHVRTSAEILPFSIEAEKTKAQLAADFRNSRLISRSLIQPHEGDAGIVCYMVFVRALRHADQKGTERGSKH